MPAPPNLANSRMHWRVKHNKKVAYWRTLTTLHLGAGGIQASPFPKTPRNALTKVRITAHFVLGNTMDQDNLMARCKWPIDWLKEAGYLVDDSPKHLTWTGIPTQEVSRKTPPTLTLTVETAE